MSQVYYKKRKNDVFETTICKGSDLLSYFLKIYFTRFSANYFRRPMIEYLRENNTKKNLVGVEIGVNTGHNSYNILYSLPIWKLYLVDPYCEYWENELLVNKSKNYQHAKRILAKYDDRIQFIKKPSDKATDDIPDNLDFVYIDGCHDYPFVKKDIENYYPKIRVGGIIGGHDYFGNFRGVIDAVSEFERRNNKRAYTSKHDWWVIKK